MGSTELLSFIPMLLYGIGLAELFSQWRRFFDKEYLYWPYVIMTVVLTEIAIWNVYLFFVKIDQYTVLDYYEYWSILAQPIIFLLAVHAFTPEPGNKDTEGYFKSRMLVIFILIAVYIGLHLLPGVSTEPVMIITRIVTVILCLLIAFTKYVPLIYALGILWIVSLFLR